MTNLHAAIVQIQEINSNLKGILKSVLNGSLSHINQLCNVTVKNKNKNKKTMMPVYDMQCE